MDPEEDGYDITDSVIPRTVEARPVSYLSESGQSGAAVLFKVDDQAWTFPLEAALRVCKTLTLACTVAYYASMLGANAAAGSPDDLIGRGGGEGTERE